MSIDDILRSLNRNEVTVLYWKCRELQYKQIALRYGKSVQWAQGHMTHVYEKFGIEKKTHHSERWEFLQKEVCPLLSELVGINTSKLEEWPLQGAETTEEIQHTPEEVEEPINIDQEILSLVVFDERSIIEANESALQKIPPTVITIPARPNPIVRLLRLGIFSILLCLAISAVSYFAFRAGQGSNAIPSEIGPNVANSTLETQEVQQPSNTAVPSDTPVSPPTLTVEPTSTVIPTITPNPNIFFYDFTGGLDAAWSVIFGKPIIVNEQLTSAEYTMLSFGDPTWTDYEIEFDLPIERTVCAIGDRSNAIGVRASNLDNMLIYYIANCESAWYYVSEGNKTAIPNARTGNMQDPMHLIIRVEGNKITVHNRSDLVISFIDNDYQMGNIFVQILPKSQFDNFKVTLLNR